VPLGFDKERLADALRHHPILSPNATTDGDGEDRGIDVHVDTLAADVQNPEQVATVRFPAPPPALQVLKSSSQLTIDVLVAAGDAPVGAQRKTSPSQAAVRLTIDEHFHGTTVLHSPRDHDINVLAVSGLGSHAFGSFVHKKDGHMWLRDGLPRHLPTARVMIYGYESGLQRSTSVANLGDLASSLRIAIVGLLQSQKQRVILIGHSLGGLLIKEALVQIAASDAGLDLMAPLLGMLFFGVPNDGMDIGSLIPIVGDQPNRFLLESLNAMNSQILGLQRQAFSKLSSGSDFEMFCFFETEQSPTAAEVSTIGVTRRALLTRPGSGYRRIQDDRSASLPREHLLRDELLAIPSHARPFHTHPPNSFRPRQVRTPRCRV